MPRPQPDVLAASRRTYWQLVNFGVVAVARAVGAAPDERLLLRCECGAPGCVARVALTRAQYERGAPERVLLGAGHLPAEARGGAGGTIRP